MKQYKVIITGSGDKYDIEVALTEMLDTVKWMAEDEDTFIYGTGELSMEIIEIVEKKSEL